MAASFRASSGPFTVSFVFNRCTPGGRGCMQHRSHASAFAELQWEHLSSVQNKTVKHAVKLRTSTSYRSETGRLLLAGATVLMEQFNNRGHARQPPEILTLFLDKSCAIPDNIVAGARKVVTVDPHVMKKLAGVQDATSIGAVAEVSMPQGISEQQWKHARRVLVLDKVQDPGNVGTLLRNAEALQWDAVFLLDGCCDVFNEKAVRAARGATFTVSLGKGSWQEFHSRAEESGLFLLAAAPSSSVEEVRESNGDVWDMSTARDVLDPSAIPSVGHNSTDSRDRKLGTAMNEADSIVGSDSAIDDSQGAGADHGKEPDISELLEQLESSKLALVLGSEGQGLRPEALKECRKVSIPMIGETESLNVAAAGSMLMLVLSQSLKGVLQRLHGAMNE